MGTNYYWAEAPCANPCEHCKQESIHIGKSSAGWCFALHVGDDAPDSLAGWLERFAKPGSAIRDEYGRTVTPEEMFAVITIRNARTAPPLTAEWLQENDAEVGPGGLARCRVGSRSSCVGHGEGTFDLCAGAFS